MNEFKQAIIVRKDLPMSCGKLAVQVAHAAVMGSEVSKGKNKKNWNEWISQGSKKVVLTCENLNELLTLHRKALELGVPCYLVVDAGLTELPPGTVTALAVGPDTSKKVDKICGNLPLLK